MNARMDHFLTCPCRASLRRNVCDRIFGVRGVARILIVLLIVAALPLRGYAAAAADLCAEHHGGGQSEHVHDHESTDPQSGHGGEHSSSSTCSHCASCSVGVSFLSDSAPMLNALIGGADRIPFFDARKPVHVPDHLDRPPLVS